MTSFDEIAAAQGWNETTQLDVLRRYVDNQQDDPALTDFAARIAEEENADDAPSDTTTTPRDYVDEFETTLRAFNNERAEWNTMPTPEARIASGIELDHDSVRDAALALMADAADRHHIEQRAHVYLVLGSTGWAIDSPTFDGGPLDGYESPLNSECEHQDHITETLTAERLNDECQALLNAAEWIDAPTADELTTLMNDYK